MSNDRPIQCRRWILGVVVMAMGIAINSVPAQTRDAERPNTVRITLGHGAVIEHLVPAMVVRGVLLDSSGNPADGTVAALPMTTDAVSTDREGRFELFWSPDWLGKEHVLRLLASTGDYGEVEAAILQVADPTNPVTIRLSPGLSLDGRVIDPNGREVPNYDAILSLAADYKCRVPISDRGAVRALRSVPFGATYELTILADGYRAKSILIDATDRSKPLIDLGNIVLERRGPNDSPAHEPSPYPNWAEAFARVYRLDDGEVLKLIEMPYILERQEFLVDKRMWTPSNWAFFWDGQPKAWFGSSPGPVRLVSMLWHMFHIPSYDLEASKYLVFTLPDGDWVFRSETPVDERLAALQEIIRSKLNRSVRFEKRKVERKTVVVTGEYSFTSTSKEYPGQLHIFTDNTLSAGYQPHEVDSLIDLFGWLGNAYYVPFDVRTRQTSIPKIVCRISGRYIEGPEDKNLPHVLDRLTEQTGLTFTIKTLPAEVWMFEDYTRAKLREEGRSQ